MTGSKRAFLAIAVATSSVSVLAFASPAVAGHTHYVVTPNGACHQVAAGQTAIDDASHGGYHQFHDHVHLRATESDAAPDTLGDGRAAVDVYKEGAAPAVCDGE